MNINFIDLPSDIKLYIYSFNKDREKHNFLLNKCLNEIKHIQYTTCDYFDFVYDYIGKSVWDHNTDYEYWISLEYIEKDIKKYYLKKKKIIKYYINNYLYIYN